MYAKAKAELIVTLRKDELLCVTHVEQPGAEDVERINEADLDRYVENQDKFIYLH